MDAAHEDIGHGGLAGAGLEELLELGAVRHLVQFQREELVPFASQELLGSAAVGTVRLRKHHDLVLGDEVVDTLRHHTICLWDHTTLLLNRSSGCRPSPSHHWVVDLVSELSCHRLLQGLSRAEFHGRQFEFASASGASRLHHRRNLLPRPSATTARPAAEHAARSQHEPLPAVGVVLHAAGGALLRRSICILLLNNTPIALVVLEPRRLLLLKLILAVVAT